MNEKSNNTFWFPGRWVGGGSLIIGPMLILIGILLRSPFYYFFDAQLKAYTEHPMIIIGSYSCFVLGNILLWPAIITLARSIGMEYPNLAIWGGCLVILGLFARTFHGGIDHLAFQLVDTKGVEMTTKVVEESYGAFHIVRYLNGAIVAGWVVLAIGAYRSKILGRFQSISLSIMAILPLGTLKGTRIESIIGTILLCISLIPLGFKIISDGPRPSRRSIIWTVIFIINQMVIIILSIFFPEFIWS